MWSDNGLTYRRTVTPNSYRTHAVPKFSFQCSWITGACHSCMSYFLIYSYTVNRVLDIPTLECLISSGVFWVGSGRFYSKSSKREEGRDLNEQWTRGFSWKCLIMKKFGFRRLSILESNFKELLQKKLAKFRPLYYLKTYLKNVKNTHWRVLLLAWMVLVKLQAKATLLKVTLLYGCFSCFSINFRRVKKGKLSWNALSNSKLTPKRLENMVIILGRWKHKATHSI